MNRAERDRQAAARLESRLGPVDCFEVPAEIVDPTPPVAPEPPVPAPAEIDEPPEITG